MVRFPTLVAAVFAVCITTAAYAAPATNEMAAELGQTLTLGSAKQMVADKLKTAGQTTMRPGTAEFDADGNVKVEIVNLQGLPVSHVVVHANNGQITDAASAKKRG
jgi:predicted phage tail protein